jgi:hypothetical protein
MVAYMSTVLTRLAGSAQSKRQGTLILLLRDHAATVPAVLFLRRP